MLLGDVVDQFHDHDRFAHARAAKRADFATFEKGADQVDHFDARRENLCAGGLVGQRRRRAVNRIAFVGVDRSALVHRLARDVEDSPHDCISDRHGNGRAGIEHVEAALQPLGAGHGDGAHPIVAQVLLHFEGQFVRLPFDLIVDG